MQTRRSIALTIGAVVLSVPALVSCGFNYATDRPYTQAVGVNHVGGPVDVLNAVIVSAADGSGTFIATLNNNSQTKATTFDSLAPGLAGGLEAAEFTPQEIGAGGFLNLAKGGGVEVTGDFVRGQFVKVVVGVDGGDSVMLSVPVIKDDGAFTGLAPSGSPSVASSDPAGVTPEVAPTQTPTASASPTQ